MKKVIVALGLVQLSRTLSQRRRVALERRRKNFGILGLAAGVSASVLLRAFRKAAKPAPAWPSKKTLAHDARIAARGQAPVKPPAVHLERDAGDALKVSLGDLTR